MRLIDSNELAEELSKRVWYEREDEKQAVRIVKEFPTVDAVPVVRCKDCRWWKTNYTWNGKEVRVCVIESYEPCRKPDDYCSRGERKDGADDGRSA